MELINDYTKFPFVDDATATIFTGSACEFSNYGREFEKCTNGKKLGAIIFSPPYANSFDYFESYKMELLFGQLLSPNDYQVQKNSKFVIIEFAAAKNCTLSIQLSKCYAAKSEMKYPRKRQEPASVMAEPG